MSVLIEFALYLSIFSIATERLVELFKLAIPKKQWESQTLWQFFIGAIATGIGAFLAWNMAPEAYQVTTGKHIAFSLLMGLSTGVGSKVIRDYIVKTFEMNKA